MLTGGSAALFLSGVARWIAGAHDAPAAAVSPPAPAQRGRAPAMADLLDAEPQLPRGPGRISPAPTGTAGRSGKVREEQLGAKLSIRFAEVLK